MAGKLNRKTKITVILAPIMIVLLALMITAQVVMTHFSTIMNQFLGGGELVITKLKGTEDLPGDYYEFETKSNPEALEFAQNATKTIVGEGSVLLKNDTVSGTTKSLPLKSAKPKITMFGYNALHPNMSGGEDPRVTANAWCFDNGFIKQGIDVNPATITMYEKVKEEQPVSAFTSDITSTYANYNEAAVMVIKRNSGEGNDQSKVVAADNNRTGLSLSSLELDVLDHACKNFNNVIVIINAANAMELGFLKDGASYTDPYTKKIYNFANIKSAIWCGGMGSTGTLAVADIIMGKVNPSGHLPDLYTRDHTKDPTYVNFGDFKYTNIAAADLYKTGGAPFVEYEEGIYIGYRYYETAAFEASKSNYAGFDYSNAVTYPFGYGLSYSTFSTKYIATPSFSSSTNSFTFKVQVTNTGSYKGKHVAQIYVSSPYTSGGIEKSHVELVGFAKTGELDPGKSQNLEIVVNRDYFTTFDYKTEKCYILDASDYYFYLSDDSHSWAGIQNTNADKAWKYNIGKKTVFGADNKRPTDFDAAINKFDTELNWKFKEKAQETEGFVTNFSRKDFKNTFPTAPKGNDFIANDYVKKEMGKYDVTKAAENASTEMTASEMPVTNAEKVIKLADLRGIDYSDAAWDTFMNQFTVESMTKMYTAGGWVEQADKDNGVPESYDMDSPYGFYAFSKQPENINKWYQTAPVLAATFNIEMADLMGRALGEEAQGQRYKANKPFLITGLYGPGANTHRSPFGGRNYEYFSEDPVLSGKMSAAEVSAASQKGLIAFNKHYFLNDQETNRQVNGYCVWVNEQALREVYNRGWEIYSKESKMTVNYYQKSGSGFKMVSKEMPAATGIMTAYNRIGPVWAGASIAVEELLRKEAGFKGTSITDAGGTPNDYMNSDKGLRTGGTDLCLTGSGGINDSTSPTAVLNLKRACKNILYNKANSNCMIGLVPGSNVSYTMAPWQIGLMIAWIVVGLIVVAGTVFLVLVYKNVIKFKNKPE